MYCSKCGNEILENTRFCSKCGQENNLAHNSESFIQTRNPFPGIITIGLCLLGLFIVVALIFSSMGDKTLGDFVLRVVNILLALMGLLSVLGMLFGVVFGIIFLRRAGESSHSKSHYNKLAVYSFVTPVLFVVSIMLGFVIIRVISNINL